MRRNFLSSKPCTKESPLNTGEFIFWGDLNLSYPGDLQSSNEKIWGEKKTGVEKTGVNFRLYPSPN